MFLRSPVHSKKSVSENAKKMHGFRQVFVVFSKTTRNKPNFQQKIFQKTRLRAATDKMHCVFFLLKHFLCTACSMGGKSIKLQIAQHGLQKQALGHAQGCCCFFRRALWAESLRLWHLRRRKSMLATVPLWWCRRQRRKEKSRKNGVNEKLTNNRVASS